MKKKKLWKWNLLISLYQKLWRVSSIVVTCDPQWVKGLNSCRGYFWFCVVFYIAKLRTCLTHAGVICVGFKTYPILLIQSIKEQKTGVGFFSFFVGFVGIILQVKDLHRTGRHEREAVWLKAKEPDRRLHLMPGTIAPKYICGIS